MSRHGESKSREYNGLRLLVVNIGSDVRLPLSGDSPAVETQQCEKHDAVPVQSLTPVSLVLSQMMQFLTVPEVAFTAAVVALPETRLDTTVQFSTVAALLR